MSSEVRVAVGYNPRSYMRPFHESGMRFGVLVCHRRAGKTVAAINHLVRHILRCPLPAPRGAYIAPTFAQAKDIAWSYLKTYTATIPGVKYHESELKVTFPNGGTIRLYGSENPDRLRGLYFDCVIIDEFASMQPDIWEHVVRPGLSDRKGSCYFLGTPKGKDQFYDIWRHALKNPGEWFALMLKASQTGILSIAELKDNLALMDKNTYMREFECSFEVAGDQQFISKLEVDAAFERSSHGTGPILIGVDVARFGTDRTVILVRNGDVIEYVGVWQNLNTMRTAIQVTEIFDRYKPQMVFVDGVGIGAAVVDRLNALGYSRLMDVNSGRAAMDRGRFMNLRAEMWSRMRTWIRERAALSSVKDHYKELSDDLTALNYDFDNRDRLKLESKDDLKARGLPSPDLADALALTFAHRMAPPDVIDMSYRALSAVDMVDPLAEFSA
jgi:hypothetical protein